MFIFSQLGKISVGKIKLSNLLNKKFQRGILTKGRIFKSKATIPLALGTIHQLIEQLFVIIIIIKIKFYKNMSKINSSPQNCNLHV